MITLGGVTISDDMYLGGIETASLTAFSQTRTVDGTAYVQVKATPGGRALTLGSTTGQGAQQGFWCQAVIDALKGLESLASPVTLDYHGEIYLVLITSTASLVQFNQRIAKSDTKAYTGLITLLEV